MRQKSATQFGGVPRLSRLIAPEAMILSYDFFAHLYLMGSMLEDCLFLEIPTPVSCLRDYSFRQARDFDFYAVVQHPISHIPFHFFSSLFFVLSIVFNVPISILANCLGGHLTCLVAIVLVSRSHAPIPIFTSSRGIFFYENLPKYTVDTVSGLESS